MGIINVDVLLQSALPPGPTGPQGPQGEQGPQGPQGTGPQGPQGPAANVATVILFAASDETTILVAGDDKIKFRAPSAMSITQIPRASLSSASTSGNVIVDINLNGSSILGANKLSIDQNATTSTTAQTQTTLATDPTSVSDDAEFSVDIDSAGVNATGLKVTIYYNVV
jgi:hypothetical protein